MRKKEIRKFFGWGFFLILFFLGHNFLVSIWPVVENRGISWGWGEGFAVWLAGGIWFILFLGAKRTESFGVKLMLLGGAVNLLDRLIFGTVRDYWQFFGGVYNNVADFFIGFGLVIFAVELWKKK